MDAKLALIKLLKEREHKLKKIEYQKNWYERNKERLKEKNKIRYIKNKEKLLIQRKNRYQKNKQKELIKNKNWRKANQEKVLLQSKKYYQANKHKILKRTGFYHKIQLQINVEYKLRCYLRNRVYYALKSKNWRKHNTTKELLGCTLDELKQHLEKQFQPGMTWENQGKWHIDHIKPLSRAETLEELYRRCHYTNLQPLWGFDNIAKGAKEDLYDGINPTTSDGTITETQGGSNASSSCDPSRKQF